MFRDLAKKCKTRTVPQGLVPYSISMHLSITHWNHEQIFDMQYCMFNQLKIQIILPTLSTVQQLVQPLQSSHTNATLGTTLP
jgi:hypothetical protein